MENRANWIFHKGKKILFADYNGLDKKQILNYFPIVNNMIQKETSKVLFLVNFENTVIDSDLMAEINSWGKMNKNLVDKTAVLGVTGIKKVLLNGYVMVTGQQVKAFGTLNEAKDYLIS